jgi:regulation of enolase protein 1 (concanavalin A-like superfamily)
MKRAFAVVLFFLASASGWSADYAQAGVLAKDGGWELSVLFSSQNPAVVPSLSLENYLLPQAAQFDGIRSEASANAVILSLSGLATNASYVLGVTNLQTVSGAILPGLSLGFTTKPLSWAAVGAQELGFGADALAVGTNGFDLISGGSQMSAEYDESTFVYEKISGDFDRRVRVAFQDGSSAQAKAGLMVRESLDESRTRPLDRTDPQQAFSRYLQIAVNPATTAYTDFDGTPVPGANQYQISVRLLPGDDSQNPAAADTNAPPYPNAWMRVKRVGQTFHVFRGSDGTNWVKLGTFTFPTTDADGNAIAPFSARAFVGVNYAPEVANIPISTGEQRAFTAQFRDYGEASGQVDAEQPTLRIAQDGTAVELTWSAGTLQGSTNLAANAWADLSTALSLKLPPNHPYQFFRARNP